MASTPSTRRQLDGVAVGYRGAPDSLVDLRTGALGATAHALDHDHSMKLEMKPGMWAPGHSPPPRRRQLSSAADVDVP